MTTVGLPDTSTYTHLHADRTRIVPGRKIGLCLRIRRLGVRISSGAHLRARTNSVALSVILTRLGWVIRGPGLSAQEHIDSDQLGRFESCRIVFPRPRSDHRGPMLLLWTVVAAVGF